MHLLCFLRMSTAGSASNSPSAGRKNRPEVKLYIPGKTRLSRPEKVTHNFKVGGGHISRARIWLVNVIPLSEDDWGSNRGTAATEKRQVQRRFKPAQPDVGKGKQRTKQQQSKKQQQQTKTATTKWKTTTSAARKHYKQQKTGRK